MKFVSTTFLVIFSGCNIGHFCSVKDNSDGTKTILCEDGSDVTISNGKSCTVVDNKDNTQTISCENGTVATVTNGVDGTDGVNGGSCSVVDNDNGTKTIFCEDGTEAIIADGVNGLDEVDVFSDMLKDEFGHNVVTVNCLVGEANVSHGTGTKTASNTIITAHHVIDGCDDMEYYHDGILVGYGGIPFQYGRLDTVEIQPNTWTEYGNALAGVVPVFNTTRSIGEIVYCLSYPANILNDLQVTSGRVVDDNFNNSLYGSRSAYWNNAFTADYVATGGSSGAPVFTRNGEWVAIHVGGYSGPINLDIDIALPFQL